ncbi:hypothetical protein IX307_002200 [Bacteroides pyogenes]|uniref:GNAT family N-acetyltransferase n=5 Tax=Bacteroides pyogenes TaxID=310300 RepID=A0A5D3FCZ2_9BACE|nr:GNAT family N-acetyltransferase [Bacteroides pyogenes]MBR8704393.1 hypothetical protein [Bacteroides pyogenes]MBR8708625.1 hypothetical protein [Bacteroides pyogenes]MBR8716929.1 hypothetical protein [Bacteroides pyogenes]MBR8721021.1 hypothetical protein [Bacteroides pyogenes]MBR8725114.1 hypothetical protein [Bacteroides pyogenes]
MKEKVKTLWSICFNDSKAFIDMYFRLRYKSNVNIAIESGGEIISALQMLPYPMTFCGNTVQTSYVSGACTHPDFRGKGVMRELLSQAFARMFHGEVLFSTLIPAEPWLFDYYKQMGYASVFGYSIQEISIPDTPPLGKIKVKIVTKSQKEVYQYLNRKLSERACCIQHTAEDFRVIMTDLSISGGILFTAKQDETIKGLAILYKREKGWIINELFADTQEIEHNLLLHIKKQIGEERITRLLPSEETPPPHLLGMARIINPKKVLDLYATAFPEEEMQLELTDKQLSVNNGYYYLCNGKCMFSTERLPGRHLSMDISELTKRILLPLRPYMSLMLN